MITRGRSEADRRRTYVRLVPAALDRLVPHRGLRAPRVVFVCTHNSARSQLAPALWGRGCTGHAVSVARRHGRRLDGARTAHVADLVGISHSFSG